MSVYLVKGTKIWRYNFVRNGIRFRTIQEILGHEKMSTTEIYLHNITGAEKIAIDTLEENYRHTESHTKSVNHLKLVP